jgi:hypothetical protein
LLWNLNKVLGLVLHLQKAILEADSMTLLLLHRDLLIVTLLWNTCSRGPNAGSWRLENIKFPSGKLPLGRLYCQ